MANTDRPFGAKPVGHITGAPWNGQFNIYYVPSGDGTAIYKYDFVESAGSADSTGMYPSVQQATAGNYVRGVAIGFGSNPEQMINPSDLEEDYRAADTERYVAVIDDPDVIFEMQEDSVGGALAKTDAGSNADFVVGSGSTTTGLSGMEIDSGEAGTGADALRLLRIVNRPDNELGTNAKWLIRINYHELRYTTGD